MRVDESELWLKTLKGRTSNLPASAMEPETASEVLTRAPNASEILTGLHIQHNDFLRILCGIKT